MTIMHKSIYDIYEDVLNSSHDITLPSNEHDLREVINGLIIIGYEQGYQSALNGLVYHGHSIDGLMNHTSAYAGAYTDASKHEFYRVEV